MSTGRVFLCGCAVAVFAVVRFSCPIETRNFVQAPGQLWEKQVPARIGVATRSSDSLTTSLMPKAVASSGAFVSPSLMACGVLLFGMFQQTKRRTKPLARRRVVAQAAANGDSDTKTAAFDLERYLVNIKNQVDAALDECVISRCKEDQPIVDAMRYSLLAGGKRIRPIMCIATCAMARKRALGEDPTSFEIDADTLAAAMPTAVALELIHTMSLIHDDLPALDNDDLRRGSPSCHVKYGEDIALLAGDALLSEAFAIVARSTPQVGASAVSGDRIIEVIRRLGDSVGSQGLAAGEAMDLKSEDRAVNLDELRWIHRHKTGALLEVAVAAGAVLGGMDLETEVPQMETYARDIGLAFQVQDDILDITATTEELGKTAAKDLDQLKSTYPKLMGLDGAQQEAGRLANEAMDALKPFGVYATPLVALAKFIVSRGN